MSKQSFQALRARVEELCGTDWLYQVPYTDEGFTANINVIKSDAGTSWAIKSPNDGRTESIVGFSFPQIAAEFGFVLKPGHRYEYEGKKKKASKSKPKVKRKVNRSEDVDSGQSKEVS